MKALLLFLISLSSLSFAQEQMALRINQAGLMKVMQMALKYNTGTQNSRTVVIPHNLYKFTIKQKDLAANPVISLVNEISNLNLNKDFDFYLHTSDIKVTGKVDPKSLSTVITNSGPNGFDIKLSINLTSITANAPKMTLCEDKVPKYKKCGTGLKTSVSGLKIITLNRPVILTSTMRLTIKNGMASVKVLDVNSNLEGKSAPTLDVNFTELEVPRIAVVINDQETELDTSKLKDQILERKSFLGKKLLSFAGDFIASDLAEMINVYLANTQIATTLQVYHRDDPEKFDEMEPQFNVAEADATYVRPPIIIQPFKSSVIKTESPKKEIKPLSSTYSQYDDRYKVAIDNTYVKPSYVPIEYLQKKPSVDVMKILMDQFALVIRHAQVDLSLKSIKTPSNKDIELAGVLNFILNHRTFTVKSTLGNSSRTLPLLDLSPYRYNDLNIAISEPVINGALDLVSSTGLFQELLEEVSDVDALGFNNLKLHFTGSNSIKVIANLTIDLKKVRTSFWKDPKGWAETEIGEWLESNNNNSVIYFPLEIEVIPVVGKTELGEATLSLIIKSPFTSSGQLLNTYKYPSNVGKMFNIVRKAVLKQLHDQLDQYADKTFSVDLANFLNRSGVIFTPKSISINQSAYLLLNLDIKDIKFNSTNPTQK